MDKDAALSLRKAATYMSISYGEFLRLCRLGMVRTELKFPGSKRRITTRAWCDDARRQWDGSGKLTVKAKPPGNPFAGMTGAEFKRSIGL